MRTWVGVMGPQDGFNDRSMMRTSKQHVLVKSKLFNASGPCVCLPLLVPVPSNSSLTIGPNARVTSINQYDFIHISAGQNMEVRSSMIQAGQVTIQAGALFTLDKQSFLRFSVGANISADEVIIQNDVTQTDLPLFETALAVRTAALRIGVKLA